MLLNWIARSLVLRAALRLRLRLRWRELQFGLVARRYHEGAAASWAGNSPAQEIILSQKPLTTAARGNGGHDKETPATSAAEQREPTELAIMDALVREVNREPSKL